LRVYVINLKKEPLMPTIPSKARKLLKQNKAKVVSRTPFTIQLLYSTGETKQGAVLGVDAGSKFIGLSVTTDKQELFSAELELRNDIVDLLSTRRQNRRTRRNRLRYRKARFLNRVKSKNKGWLAPSIEHKINTHLNIIYRLHKILPITKIIVEVASFDIQKIKNPNIEKEEYQHGEQVNFWNTREYILFRDNHTCQHCKGKSKDKILNVHHIESRKTGGNSPNNLIVLCETCHNKHHKGEIELKVKRGKSFKDASFMGIMRWAFYNKLKELYSNVSIAYGYITKNTRITNNLPKSHRIDAFCISGNSQAKRLTNWFYYKKVRCHNRQIHKVNILKGGKKKLNQAKKYVFNYQLFDKIKYNKEECFIFGRRTSGSFDIRKLDGTKISAGISYKKLNLLEKRKNILIERREGESPHT
jgi:hypothetical protein